MRLGAIGTAGLRHVRPSAAALAAERFGAKLDQIDSTDALGEIVGDANNQRCAAFGHRGEGDDTGSDLHLGVVGKTFEVLRVHAFDDAQHGFHTGDFFCSIACFAARRSGKCQRLLRIGQFALQPAAVFRQGQRARGQFGGTCFQCGGGLARQLRLIGKPAPRAFGGQRLDAANARRHRTFAEDREDADVAQAAHMRAAAKLDGVGLVAIKIAAHGEHAHFVAIFLAEQRFRARLDRLIGRHQARGDVGVLPHHRIHLVFDAVQLILRDGLGVREVEAQPVRRDERALLADMRPQHALQRRMQKVRRRVVGARRTATLAIDAQFHRIA